MLGTVHSAAVKISLDIVDYPGEWLLDLPLLGKTYEHWSSEATALSKLPNRNKLAAKWHAKLASIDPQSAEDETSAREQAALFTDYLRACKQDRTALSTLPPGRFLMPGDLAGSPALTFAPLNVATSSIAAPGTLHAMMARRFEAYKTIVVKPFFREHFARLDRQIVLVDALQALNAGKEAIMDLENALTDILDCFRPGKASWLTSLFSSRTDKILFAATKADHLHHENHDRLEKLLSHLVANAIKRAKFAGAEVDVVALAAIRATREAELIEGKEKLPVIVGTPLANEAIDGEVFDGQTETAIFPGDLPAAPEKLLVKNTDLKTDLNFVRFKPPKLDVTAEGISLSLPHIRLDRALEFLLGDQLQ